MTIAAVIVCVEKLLSTNIPHSVKKSPFYVSYMYGSFVFFYHLTGLQDKIRVLFFFLLAGNSTFFSPAKRKDRIWHKVTDPAQCFIIPLLFRTI